MGENYVCGRRTIISQDGWGYLHKFALHNIHATLTLLILIQLGLREMLCWWIFANTLNHNAKKDTRQFSAGHVLNQIFFLTDGRKLRGQVWNINVYMPIKYSNAKKDTRQLNEITTAAIAIAVLLL